MNYPLEMRREPEDFVKKLNEWNWKAARWRWMHFTLGAISIVLSITIATFSSELSKQHLEAMQLDWLKIITFANALSVAAISAYSMGDRATAVRQACRQLEAAIYRYRWNPAITIEDLTSAFELAQATMGHPSLRGTPNK